MKSNYLEFLKTKTHNNITCGFIPKSKFNTKLFPFEKDIVKWALQKGRAAIFADCGLGKTIMQLEWAQKVVEKTNKPVLILAPLSVAQQTVNEGIKFNISVNSVRKQSEVKSPGIYITNYEILSHFNPDIFSGIVLDESSILKSFDGKTRNEIISAFGLLPYRLACTATPAPNDHMELGNHSEFLGIMTRTEMLSTFFIHDGAETSKWRLKRHAQKDFWFWMCSWAVMLSKPSDLGYDDKGFILPPLNIIHKTVKSDLPNQRNTLFEMEAHTLEERRLARKGSITSRVKESLNIINQLSGKGIIWCDYNAEQEALTKIFEKQCVSISGSTPMDKRIELELSWRYGNVPVLITKPEIFGWGMNWQHCSTIIFCGLSDSYEKYYQAIRRCWRFGQTQQVNCHIITSDAENAVIKNIRRKNEEAKNMQKGMIENMRIQNKKDLQGTQRKASAYVPKEKAGNGWNMYLEDCIEGIKKIGTNTIDYSIFSPPFASLYTYSDSERDMGNSRTHKEFYTHFNYLIPELLRVTVPGKLLSFHCMNLPTSKTRDGVIGITDFRGILIKAFVDAGWIYHSEVVIWKNPVTAMQRTKALGLLHKQLKKDSCMSRQGIPDYLVTLRKPGENIKPVTHTNESFPVSVWQNYASPVWMDINPSNTLQHRSVREHADERHICPLQLEVIRRAILLWTNPDDLILSPFAGIGSEGYIALETGRKFIGVELKTSYWKQACCNLKVASELKKRRTLFD